MSLDAVLTAGQPGNNSAPAVTAAAAMAAVTGKDKCIPLSALLAAKNVRYPSNPAAEDRYTALTAILP